MLKPCHGFFVLLFPRFYAYNLAELKMRNKCGKFANPNPILHTVVLLMIVTDHTVLPLFFYIGNDDVNILKISSKW